MLKPNMETHTNFSIWKELTILIGFPILYMFYCASPFAMTLFDDNDITRYIPVWGGIIVLHWISIYSVYLLLKKQNKTFKDIGYKLSKKGTLILIVSFSVVAFIVFGFTEMILDGAVISDSELSKLPSLIPTTTAHRFFFILLVFSTGFCEEIVYRGFALDVLQKAGINKWIAIVIAAFIFIGIHGFYAYTNRFVSLMVGGIIFGIIFILSKRLLPSIIVHLLINLISMMAILQFVK